MTWDGLLPAMVMLPLVFAVVAAVVRGRAATAVGVAGTFAAAGLAGAIALGVGLHGPLHHDMGGWSVPVGIVLRADGLSAAFLALTAVVVVTTSVYAASSGASYGTEPRFWPLLLLLWSGLAAVMVAGDLFNAYVGLEVVSLCAVGLVALGGRGSWGPALRYLLVAAFGSMLYLLAVAMVYGMTGTLDIREAGALIAADPTAGTGWPLALAVVGLGIKSALFPLHAWLPSAHASAPAAVSPVLSALVVKSSFVVLVRVWFEVLGPHPAVAVVLAWCSAGAVLGAGALALVERSLKRIVAYSTVGQVGYLVLLFPLTTLTDDPAVRQTVWAAVVLLGLAHGLAKAAIFLAAGSLKLAAGTDELGALVHAARSLRTTTISLALAATSLVGLPVSLGFAAKWMLVTGAVQSGQWWAVALLLAGSLLSAAYLLRPVALELRADSGDPVHRDDLVVLPPVVRHAPLALALLVVVLGLNARWLAGLSLVGASWGALP